MRRIGNFLIGGALAAATLIACGSSSDGGGTTGGTGASQGTGASASGGTNGGGFAGPKDGDTCSYTTNDCDPSCQESCDSVDCVDICCHDVHHSGVYCGGVCSSSCGSVAQGGGTGAGLNGSGATGATGTGATGTGATGTGATGTGTAGSGGAGTGANGSGANGTGATGTAPACGGLGSNDATCDSCFKARCCTQGTACGSDTTCVACLATPSGSGCSTDAALMELNTCLSAQCSAECGGGSGGGSGGSPACANDPTSCYACCDKATNGGVTAAEEQLILDCGCATGSTCAASCVVNGTCDPTKPTQACVTCLNGLPMSDACMSKFATDCQANATCVAGATCVNDNQCKN